MSQPSLHFCNLSSRYGQKKALEIINGTKPKKVAAAKVETVATPADEKRELAKQIEALNGTVPHHRSSVAKYEQALIAAKED